MENTKPNALLRKTVLVIGANGKTGRKVAEKLAASGHKVLAASRSGTTRFDWQDHTTWAPALDGADAAYLTYYPDLALPGAAEIVGAFAEVAVRHGVRRLVLLSGRSEPGAQHAEKLLAESGADWTVVRCAFFNQNFEELILDSILQGNVAFPAGDVQEPFLDVDDIAEVAVAALTNDRHIGQLYELTGPRLMTMSDAMADISAATGRQITYTPVSTGEFASLLASVGMSEEEAGPVAEMVSEVLDGRNSSLADGVQRALGRPAKDFRDYARETAATGIWNPEN